jgi:peptide/nickel transport system substrate-binding protein
LSLAFLCPLAADATPHVLVWANGSDINVLNPFTPGAAPNAYMTAATMAFLTRSDDGPLEPELATAVPTKANGGISADGRTITFHLRPGLQWSDGAPLTSADVAFSTDIINDPKTNISDRTGFDLITSVATPDAATVVFHISHSLTLIVDALFSTRSAPLLPKHLLQGRDVNTADYMQLPVGAGPFRYSRWLRGDRVELEANPYYFRGRPKLNKIIFRIIPSAQGVATALRTGEVDFWPAATKEYLDALSDVDSLRAVTLSGVRPQVLLLNWSSPVLSDVAVRSAIRLAIDRAAIIRRTYHGGAVLDESVVAGTDVSYAHLPPVNRDVAKANAILDAAGWLTASDGVRVKNGTRLVLGLSGLAGNAGVDQIFEQIRADLHSIGIELETRTYVPSLYFAEGADRGILAGGKFDIALFSWGQVRTSDLAVAFRCGSAVPAGTNYGHACDNQLDDLFARYDGSFDPRESQRIGQRIQERMNQVLPLIVLLKRNEYYIARDTISGFVPRPFSPFAGSLMNVDVSR